MLETFNSNGWRDFSQRYLGVYGYFPKPDGTEVLVQMADVDSSRARFVDSLGVSYYAVADTGVQFKFIPIIKKLFTHEGKLCLATRIPARQYKRGICSNNTRIMSVSDDRYIEVDFDVIKSYNTPSNRVFNSMFGIAQDKLYLYHNVIGNVVGKKLMLLQHMFKQELLDAVRDNGLSYQVEIV